MRAVTVEETLAVDSAQHASAAAARRLKAEAERARRALEEQRAAEAWARTPKRLRGRKR